MESSMKRQKLGVSLIFACLIVLSSVKLAQAEFDSSKLNASLYASCAIATDDDLNEAAYIAGRLTYEITDSIELGVESGWQNYDVKGDGEGLGGSVRVIDAGNVRGIPLLFIGSWKLPWQGMDGKLVPYVTGAVGVVFWDWNDFSASGVPDVDADGDASFAGRLGGGVEYAVNDQITLFAEGSYLWSDYELEFSGTTVSEEANMNAVYVGGGIKFKF